MQDRGGVTGQIQNWHTGDAVLALEPRKREVWCLLENQINQHANNTSNRPEKTHIHIQPYYRRHLRVCLIGPVKAKTFPGNSPGGFGSRLASHSFLSTLPSIVRLSSHSDQTECNGQKNVTAYEGKWAELKERCLSIFNLRQAAVEEAGAEPIKGR